MGTVSAIVLRRSVASAAILAAAVSVAWPACVHAQSNGTPSKSSQGGGGQKERGFSYGGEITGRMNLLAPSESQAAPQPMLPPVRPGLDPPAFITRGVDVVDPRLFKGLNLQKPKLPLPTAVAPDQTPPSLNPAAPATPAALPSPGFVAPAPKQPLSLAAVFSAKGPAIPQGVHWRVFTEQPDANGEHMLVAESKDAAPRFELDPGGYVIHAVYGLVSVAHYVQVKNAPGEERIVVPAGAVRLTALVGDSRIAPDRIGFTLTRDDSGVTRTVAENVRPGTMLRLPTGSYHIVSSYGDANSIVEVDLNVTAGKLVEAQVHHRAAHVTLKLVGNIGGQELANTSWTILTPGGDVIRESIGALPNIVLAEGDYTAIARHDGKMFQQRFAVRSGADANVEVRAQ